MKYRYLFIAGGLVIVGALFMLPTAPIVTAPVGATSSTVSAPPNASTTLVVFDGTKNIIDATIITTATLTVFSVLQLATASSGIAFAYRNYPGMGNLITRIGDKTNGANGAYWQYWVNNSYASEGADQEPVHSGDTITWKFTATQQ